MTSYGYDSDSHLQKSTQLHKVSRRALTLSIDEKVWKVKELRDQLLDVAERG